MRTLCDVCEAAPAKVFCAADEAALCQECDEKVHSCNKLASRHLRLELAESRAVPRCDICENAPAFFYCGVDGTSLCLQCDMDVHIGGKKAHERYLLMGQRVEYPPRAEDELGLQVGFANDLPTGENGAGGPSHFEPNPSPHKPNLGALGGREAANQRRPQDGKSNDISDAPAVAIAVGEDDAEMNVPSPAVAPNLSLMIDLNAQPNRSRDVARKSSLSEETSSEAGVVPQLEKESPPNDS